MFWHFFIEHFTLQLLKYMYYNKIIIVAALLLLVVDVIWLWFKFVVWWEC